MAETRAYTQAEIDKLGAAGKAYKNADGHYSFPVDNVADLKKAIRATGRAPDDERDGVRKYIVGRAKDLGQSDLIPDSWNSDGTLQKNAAWRPEQRDTANDVFTALSGAVADALSDTYSSWNVWVQDWAGAGDDADNPYVVIYYAGGDIYSAEFDYDDDSKIVIDLDSAVKVRPVTTYIPRSAKAAEAPCRSCAGAGEKRDGTACAVCGGSGEKTARASQTLEWRKRKAAEMGRTMERRIRVAPIELRGDDDSDTLTLTGYASVTGVPYDVGFYVETIERGAFRRTLNEPDGVDVQLLVNHTGLPLARTTSGTLRLAEDEKGLRVEADLDPSDPDVRALAPKMRRGDVTEMSFAFRATDQDWSEDYSERSIKQVQIHRGDVSIVSYGASPTTTETLRSQEAIMAIRKIGPDGLIAALTEWRDFTLLPLEQRAGKSISAANMDTLTKVLDLVASADDAVDQAQPLLADLMGVANPDDEQSPANDDDDGDGGSRAAPHVVELRLPDLTTERRRRLARLGGN